MKIRNDFVTNSSSSSFILAFDTKEDIDKFKEYCSLMDFEDFYKLIDNICSDFIVFSNETKEDMPLNFLIDKIINMDLDINLKAKLYELKNENYILSKYESYALKINDFGTIEINLDIMNFEDIDKDDYSIYIINNQSHRSKNTILEDLKKIYTFKCRHRILSEEPKDSIKLYDEENDYKETQEFKQLIEKYLNDSDFVKLTERIKNAELCISGMIWDTNGGILEWSIRNGFIEENFQNNCITCFNVG